MRILFLFYFTVCVHVLGFAQPFTKDRLLYSNPLTSTTDTIGWVMEGPGSIVVEDGWLKMFSPDEKGHIVWWCPKEFPESFIAEWEVQNRYTEAGLCIVFFAAKGLKGEDVLSASLPVRDGTFTQYTNGVINNYHISYYANAKNEPGRETANLRRNKGFYKVQEGEAGIPISSKAIHQVQLIKQGGYILLFIDGRKVIDWLDDGKKGSVLQSGKIGFRQMKWTQFAYRNFNVWECGAAKPE